MLKGFMYTTLVTDIYDLEWKREFYELKKKGIDFVSSVMMVIQPKFSTIYPHLTKDSRQDGGDVA